MNAVRLIRGLKENRLRVFTTRSVITLTEGSSEATTQLLRRLAQEEVVLRLKRGVWANLLVPSLRLEEAVPYLTAPWPSYVSLYSALLEHGLIAEVPSQIYAVSSGRPVRFRTPLGMISVHHLPGRALWGYEMRWSGEGFFPLATPEKALLDIAYLTSIPRSPIQMPVFRHRPRWDRRRLKKYLTRWHPAGKPAWAQRIKGC